MMLLNLKYFFVPDINADAAIKLNETSLVTTDYTPKRFN